MVHVQPAMTSRPLSLAAVLMCANALLAQDEALPLLDTDQYVMGDSGEEPAPELERYARFAKALGGDSVRTCGTMPCLGQVEDRYPDGTLMHRGYYDGGRLLVFKNYHPDGAIEREFKALDNVKCLLRTYHPNGSLRSEARYADGTAYQYNDHYTDGTLRYAEEKHRKDPYYTRMDLFAADGKPVSTLALVEKGPWSSSRRNTIPAVR